LSGYAAHHIDPSLTLATEEKQMRFKDIPDAALHATATPIPTKLAYDWDEMQRILETQGFVVIESEDTRIVGNGAEECVQVKMFNGHMRQTKKMKLYTKRLGKNRWVCVL
jgi:hypothetical protein